MPAIKRRRLATIMLILFYISMEHGIFTVATASKVKTKTKSKSLAAAAGGGGGGGVAGATSASALVSASGKLAENKMANINGHLLDMTSSTLSLSMKKFANLHSLTAGGGGGDGVDVVAIQSPANFAAEATNRHHPRSKQRPLLSMNEKSQPQTSKRTLRQIYEANDVRQDLALYDTRRQQEEEDEQKFPNANDLSSKHRRRQTDKFPKKFRLLRDVMHVEEQPMGDVIAMQHTEVDEEENDENRLPFNLQQLHDVRNISKHGKISKIRAYNNLHVFFKPTAMGALGGNTHSSSTKSPQSIKTTIAAISTTIAPPKITTFASHVFGLSHTTVAPTAYKTHKVHEMKMAENLLDSVDPSYHHHHHGENANAEPLISLLGRRPPIAKESIDLDMNDIKEEGVRAKATTSNQDKSLNGLAHGKDNEKDAIKAAIIGEVGDYQLAEDQGKDAGEEELDEDEHDGDEDVGAAANNADVDDINGFDASEDSEDEDPDDDDDDDNDDADGDDQQQDLDDDDDNGNNENDGMEDTINQDDENTTPLKQPDNNALQQESEANGHDTNDDDGDDGDVTDDVFDNDYSDTDDVFSDLSAYQNDEDNADTDDGDDDGDGDANDADDEDVVDEDQVNTADDEGDDDTTTSSPLLGHKKFIANTEDDASSDSRPGKRPYNNFTETYIKDKKNELSLDNYLRKTLPMSPVVVMDPPPMPTPPSVEVLKSELNIPITKIDQSLLVDFHVNAKNHSVSLEEQDLDFLANNLLKNTNNNNDTLTLESTKDYPSIDDPNQEPQISASTSVGGINLEHQPQGSMYEKEEINFNDSDDSATLSKDLTMEDDGYGTSDNPHANGFPLTDAETDNDSEIDTLGVDIAADSESEDSNPFLEGVVDAANADEIYDWDEISRSNRRNLMRGRDVVTKFLQIVETQHSLGSNCEAGTSLNLGEGVVDRYAQDRFRIEAEVAVNRANMLTRIFKMTSSATQAEINLLHASVLSMVEFDDDIFAAGHCFDWNEHPSQAGLFCPFAYRLPPPDLGAILAKDLAMEYHYLGNTSEWFFQARKNAEKVIARNEQYLKAFHLYSNKTDERIEDDTLAVKYEDGRWSKPYYDCGGGNIWMLTYTVPFFGYENATYHFKGTSGIDIDLRRVDIDQCPQRNIPGSTKPLNIFAGTDKCKQRTTMCEAIQGLGFRRGSYKCVCRKGYYFPDTTSHHKYFNGSLLEEEYEKLMLGKNSTYNILNEYECLPCAEGCDSCEDSSPCIAALNWPMRTSILVLACIVIGLLPPAAWFTFRYQQVKVVRAASPALLRVIALGAFFIYCTNIVMYPNPNLYTCTARIWLREIGFSLTYGALMLKTWRISVIFRVRSAKAVKITDAALLKRLGCICGAIGTCLLVRTLVSPPDVVVGRTADDLKAFLCKTDWWDYTFTSMEVVFLAWGVRLCIMVRKAPSEFNESRFISMAIYNEFLLTCFLNVSMLFLQSPANPDLLYIIFFCHTQLTITLLLALIFGSKVYIVLRSGKSHQENIGMGAKSSGAKFNFRPQVRTFANPSSVTTSTVPVAATTSAENKLSDQEAMEEIRQLSVQLQRIQEMAPPKGVAVMTISSLLDGLKTPGSMVMVAAAASQALAGSGGNQLTVRPNKPEALPLLSLNSEMQKYTQMQQQQQQQKAATNNNVTSTTTAPIPSTKVTMATPSAISVVHEEKAINTDLTGNCVAEAELKHQHIICDRCYERCKGSDDDQPHACHQFSPHHTAKAAGSAAPLTKCQLLGSPPAEGGLTFKDIKLECMCSQSDDLDQVPTRRVAKRTAATNTPPPPMGGMRGRKHSSRHYRHKEGSKALSSSSLPCDDESSQSITALALTHQPSSSYVSQRQQQQQQQQQICDNCKNKFKNLKGGKAATSKQHRKLSRLSSKCSKLLSDIENSQRIAKGATPTTTASSQHSAAPATLLHQQSRPVEGGETSSMQKQYSTDDIVFYTTTDSSSSSDQDDDDDDEDDDERDNEDRAADADIDDDNGDFGQCPRHVKSLGEDSTSSVSQSRSESKVQPNTKATEELPVTTTISKSLVNITSSSKATPSAVAASVGGSNASSALGNANNALLETKPKAASTSTAAASSTPPMQQQQQQQSQTANGNGKTKRPDKLVLNLNDRSKFTKEVSV
uniref:G-protein coupled receptors family 3 profile domain-containing protein n=1 Tax=Stomoxys calcitrans TaxID=35570 RepID=A0A1I8P846_STOCA